jgi:hypothetical protein
VARDGDDYRHLFAPTNASRLRMELESGPVGPGLPNESAKMNQNMRWSRTERGQTAVLFALMIVGLVLFVGLAVDGGNVLNERRITQNAADASALGGVHYIAVAGPATEQRLLEIINETVESNGIPDTNGVAGDSVNNNIEAYYTNAQGTRIGSPNCSVVGTCGTNVPDYAFGLEVIVNNPAETYLLGIIGQESLEISGSAVAVIQGTVPGEIADNVMIALGDCSTYDRQMTGRGNDNEFLGGLYSNSFFDATGRDNHFHGQVTYVDPPTISPPPYGTNNVFEPDLPIQGSLISDPYAGWSYMDFAPTSTIALNNAGNYWDVSILDDSTINVGVGDDDGIIEMREIINQSVYPTLYNPDNRDPITASDGVVLQPNQMRAGIYFAGDKEINIGEEAGGGQTPQGTNGTVTVVSGNRIKTTESAMNLSAFLGQGSAFPGLLFFSDFAPPYPPCEFHTEIDASINMAGNSNGLQPEVYHHPDDIPRRANPDDYIDCPYPRIDGCYVPSNAIFTGLIYAPHGRVDTSDSRTTYRGAIVAYTIDYSGDNNLFVYNPALFPLSNPMISLER